MRLFKIITIKLRTYPIPNPIPHIITQTVDNICGTIEDNIEITILSIESIFARIFHRNKARIVIMVPKRATIEIMSWRGIYRIEKMNEIIVNGKHMILLMTVSTDIFVFYQG